MLDSATFSVERSAQKEEVMNLKRW